MSLSSTSPGPSGIYVYLWINDLMREDYGEKTDAGNICQGAASGACSRHSSRIDGVTGVVAGMPVEQNQIPAMRRSFPAQQDISKRYRSLTTRKRSAYGKLIDVFWAQIDPTDPEGQFADKGSNTRLPFSIMMRNRSGLRNVRRSIWMSPESSKNLLRPRFGHRPNFFPAEEYTRIMHRRSPENTNNTRPCSGRKAFIEKIWGTNGKSQSLLDTEMP